MTVAGRDGGGYNRPMRVTADLHIHSRFSIATSPKLTPPSLDRWARIKGVDLVGTGDCTHPAWLAELAGLLEPAENGLYRLKDEARRAFDSGEALSDELPDAEPGREARFVLTGEISTIYSRDGRTRKVHHLVILPDFQAAASFQARLERVGNISSDGRPILGLDSRDLFTLLLEADDRSILIPAHIWTPWFSALGARSGFDSIEECYGDLASRIGAIETGLSSNPPMNWAVRSLDRFAVISNSDAHSPEKLGREATILDMEISFEGLTQALSGGGPRGDILRTIEFFPQEGKYHYDGHRSCGVSRSPEENPDGVCPVCGKPLTPGVLRRVTELADRPVDERAACPDERSGTNRRPYGSLVPLKELLAELTGAGDGSKKVAAAYNSLVEEAGSELGLLLDWPLEKIGALRAPGVSGELLAEAVGRVRSGRVSITPGFDGEYGTIRAFFPGERVEAKPQAGLFGTESARPARTPRKAKPKRSERKEGGKAFPCPTGEPGAETAGFAGAGTSTASDFRPDPAQRRAVNHGGGPALVLAGPGTGKTSVLAGRVAKVIGDGADPGSVLALTFTNKAAGELKARIERILGTEGGQGRGNGGGVTASTFHAFCLSVLRERAASAGLPSGFSVLAEDERHAFLEAAARGAEPGRPAAKPGTRRLSDYIEGRKRRLMLPGERRARLGPAAPSDLLAILTEPGEPAFDADMDRKYAAYRTALRAAEALDFEDLVCGTVRLLAAFPDVLAALRDRYRFVFVDEYQDVNFSQYALIRLLSPRELFVIGDPNQAIYSFRGADRRFIERFRTDYPGAAVYSLSRSFRCAPEIVGAAARLADAELTGSGAALALWRSEAPTEKAEAEGIAREIDRMIGGTRFFALDSGTAGDRADAAAGTRLGGGGAASGTEPVLKNLGECAVLVRAAALIPPIEKALRDHGLPCRAVGDRPWWRNEPSRSLLRLLTAAARPAFAALPEADGVDPVRAEALRIRLPGLSPARAVEAAAKIQGSAADAAGRLASFAANYESLDRFLDELALGDPRDDPEEHGRRGVAVMTIHAAKGLEFDHVFVAGLEEGILPFTLFDGAEPGSEAIREERIEEERRLLYVAITRARVGLHLWRARSRFFLGRKLALPASRFLSEIEDLVPRKAEAPRRERDPQPGLF